MDDIYEPVATVMCKKCGQQHTVEKYRTLLFYICPVVNRILLVGNSDEHNNADD